MHGEGKRSTTPDTRADGTSKNPTTVQEDRQEYDEGCDEQKENSRVCCVRPRSWVEDSQERTWEVEPR